MQKASEYLGISKSTLYQWTSRKMIPYLKVNRKMVYFKKSDLDDFILKSEYFKSDSQIKEEAFQQVFEGGK